MECLTLIETAYIDELFHSDPNIQMIEVWHNVLYARMKKGSGKRNRFISKKGLTYKLPIYYYDEQFVSIAKTYHPDVASRKESKVSKSGSSTSLFQLINISRPALSHLFKGRRADGIRAVRRNACFTEFTLTKSGKRADKLVQQIDWQISEAGYSDDELFGRYCLDPLDKQIGESLQLLDDIEEVLQRITLNPSHWSENLKKDDPEAWAAEERGSTGAPATKASGRPRPLPPPPPEDSKTRG